MIENSVIEGARSLYALNTKATSSPSSNTEQGKKRHEVLNARKPLKKRRHRMNNASPILVQSMLDILASQRVHQPKKTPAPLYFLPLANRTSHNMHNHIEMLNILGTSTNFYAQENSNGNSLVLRHKDDHDPNSIKLVESINRDKSNLIQERKTPGDGATTKEMPKCDCCDPNTTVPLFHPDDRERLSGLQCFLREQMEFFVAAAEDANTYSRGRNKKVVVGQVGIRCVHCKHLSVKDRSKGSTYFPSSLAGIYQAAQHMCYYHFCEVCPKMSNTFKNHYVLSSRSGNGGGKDYWITSAQRMGITDTVIGLKFKNQLTNNKADDELNSEVDQSSLREIELALKDSTNIVKPEDKALITDYIFMLFSQMIPCRPVNFDPEKKLPGLVCKHCTGCNGAFFRKTISSLSRNENLEQIDKHLNQCRSCPNEIKEALKDLKKKHYFQMRQVKRGDKKAFFTQMMTRISAKSTNMQTHLNYNAK